MNNDEKKISATEGNENAKAPVQNKSAAAKQNSVSFGDWWKNLAAGIKAAIIAGLALVVIVPVVLVIALSGNGTGMGGPGGIINNGGGGGKTASYSVTVVTKGGMAMSNLPIYIYEYEDGSLGDLVDGGYAATDDKGKATFNLPKGGDYAAKIDISLPDGYEVESYYPIVSNDFEIVISSSVIPETSLIGVTYNLGDVIRDFSVTTTKGTTFTLSEVLKEKKAVLINFWYTTCSWCITEFPLMQDAYERYSDDIAVIALDPYQEDTIYDIEAFQSQYGLTFDVAKDPTTLSTAFNVTGYPTSVIIDRYGVISMIEAGAITSQRAFDVVFDHFTADDYEQKLIVNYADIVPKEKPNVEMPDASDMSQAFDGGNIEDVDYAPYPYDAKESEKEYSWPFIIGEKDGETVIYPSNMNKEGSFAQLVIDVSLEAGESLAFDYFSSTERGADVLYVIVDGKDIYSISGISEEWKTCYAYVAEETADYQLALVYQKDSSDNSGDDTVYLKNLRICDVEEIDNPTYIYRYAATNPNRYGEYQDYVEIFYNENDGYYHVGSETGPLLLANLMGYTRFNDDDYVYNMSLGTSYEAQLVRYCNYASNSQINGSCTVNEDLKQLLIKVARDNFGDPNNENEWLEFCFYYDSYGTDEELADPIKGLATFSAYEAILSTNEVELDENGAPVLNTNNYPNSLTYDRVIMPRGKFSKFTPTESGTYLISSVAPDEKGGFIDCEAWLFTADGLNQSSPWYTYLNIDKNNIGKNGDLSNAYIIAYFEAGKDYYINIAYGDVYQEGTISFRIERLGDAGSYRFSLASPSYHTALEDINGNLTETISGGIPLVLGSDGYWHEKRDDGRIGSVLYADFTGLTTIFQDKPIYSEKENVVDMIDAGAFNFALSFEDQYVLNSLAKYNNDKDACREALRAELGVAYDAIYDDIGFEGASGSVVGYAVEEVLAGKYHGTGKDMTEVIKSYISKIIKVGDTVSVVNEDGTAMTTMVVEEGNPMIGCVAVDAQLAEVLQMLMDKYVFAGVKNSWAKLCYYHQYFNEATPY